MTIIKNVAMNEQLKTKTVYDEGDNISCASSTKSASLTCSKSKPDKQLVLKQLNLIIPILTHVLTIVVYFIPLRQRHPMYELVLDEMHILGADQKDVIGDTTLKEVFLNDYWGRPISKVDSHKSWRPVGILSFRWLKQNMGFSAQELTFPRLSLFGNLITEQNPIFIARMVTVVLHAALAEMVSLLACALFQPKKDSSLSYQTLTLRSVTKLLFAFHPTHVETVANGANRPHILAIVFSLLAMDLNTPVLTSVLSLASGLLCSETAVFQVPAIIVTMTLVHWKRTEQTSASLRQSILEMLPRSCLVMLTAIIYLTIRVFLNTTDIPDGLIRPAENPFYEFKGLRRVLNYAFIICIHLGKSLCIDPIGFSHEYGFNCIREIGQHVENGPFYDYRLWISMIVGAFMLVFIPSLTWRLGGINGVLYLVLAYSWFATLFPICGILKVGTFIADRLVVASTISFSLFAGYAAETWMCSPSSFRGKGRRFGMIIAFLFFLANRVMKRSNEWMTSFDLLSSSLRTCPNSAKSNLEMSKCYSGLFPDKLDLDRAESLLIKAEKIDPNFCDVHWQFAQINYKKMNVPMFEERLVKAVLCPFTMGGALPLFQQYWSIALNDPKLGQLAAKRKVKYDKMINDAVVAASLKEKNFLSTKTASTARKETDVATGEL